jgi:hypothetical protein
MKSSKNGGEARPVELRGLTANQGMLEGVNKPQEEDHERRKMRIRERFILVFKILRVERFLTVL